MEPSFSFSLCFGGWCHGPQGPRLALFVPCMWSSPLFWILVAVMVFWALGAYNRLVRLRAAVQAADNQWQEVLRRWVRTSQAWRAAAPVQAADLADGAALAATERLEHASQVLEAALVAAQARGGERLPSHPEWDACRALLAAWTDMLANAGGTEAAEMAPWRAQAADLQAVTTIAARNAEEAMQAYQAAIGQFPASVLAQVCGFGPR